MSTPCARPRGFTLIEVLVALVIGGTVLLVCGRLFSDMVAVAGQSELAETATSRRENARRWLRQVCENAEVGLPGDSTFEGASSELRMTTWRRVPPGWLERQELRLLRQDGEFRAEWSKGGSVILVDSVRDLRFDYLLTPGASSRWANGWRSPISAPLAVRIRVTYLDPGAGADTLLLILGERG